jgi:predicted small secreted protein
MSHGLKLLIGLMALLALPSLNACNTARGMGEDVQAAGRAMSGTAQDVENKVTGDETEKPKGATSSTTGTTSTRSTTSTTK